MESERRSTAIEQITDEEADNEADDDSKRSGGGRL